MHISQSTASAADGIQLATGLNYFDNNGTLALRGVFTNCCGRTKYALSGPAHSRIIFRLNPLSLTDFQSNIARWPRYEISARNNQLRFAPSQLFRPLRALPSG